MSYMIERLETPVKWALEPENCTKTLKAVVCMQEGTFLGLLPFFQGETSL